MILSSADFISSFFIFLVKVHYYNLNTECIFLLSYKNPFKFFIAVINRIRLAIIIQACIQKTSTLAAIL